MLIESNDLVFANNIGKTIALWGFHPRQRGVGPELEPQNDECDVALLDIRDLTDDAFGQVYSVKQQYAGIEVVLINKPDNIAASIAGMKAGAIDEIMVPFDTGVLHTIITDAFERVQAARAKTIKKPLLTRFSEAMMAATFAQAGDFEGALDMLDSPPSRRTDKSAAKKTTSGS